MAEKEQVHAEESSNDESPEPRTSRSQRRFKASNMSFIEMVEMVDILKRGDYDGKHGPYPNPNGRKDSGHLRTPGTPLKEKQTPTSQPEDVEERDVYEVGEIVTTTGDVDVVEEDLHFTSAHILIGEIVVCNRDLQKINFDSQFVCIFKIWLSQG
ncbi:hypothetical protein AB205_0104900 [Aquarana catesbeiana]|uniref:Uncharacterized protein n=1 Tax=Aquarana catesbeiana TaxID=8400 RepID=A0A2G9Q8C1_AQUCT|nr:hypothetical protein AB205_0104900 [Aquarana catesbeiana]